VKRRRCFFSSAFARALFVYGAAAAGLLTSSAQAADRSFKLEAPVKNFRLPSFDEKGNRTTLIRGGEARYVTNHQIDIVDLNFSRFAGDGSTRIDTLLLAPAATVALEGNQIKLRGDQSMRLIRDEFEASGEQWAYDHAGKKIWIGKNVRVVFHSQLENLLK
jgi:hypothetical protein